MGTALHRPATRACRVATWIVTCSLSLSVWQPVEQARAAVETPTNYNPETVKQWYDKTTFNMLVDYYTEIPGRPYGTGITPENLRRAFRMVRPGYIIFYAKGHSGTTAFKSRLGTEHPMLGDDPLKVVRQVTRECGVKLILYYSGQIDGAAAERHPEWRVAGGDGQLRPRPVRAPRLLRGVQDTVDLDFASQGRARSPAASWADEEPFARDLFQRLPANIPCFGWWDAGQGGEEGCGENGPYSGVELASKYGKFEICTAFDGFGRGVGNLSVHSGTTASFRQPPPPSPPALANKVYYTYTRTDGDGMNFWRQVYRNLWDQPAHGRVPVGWQLGPTAVELIPDIIDYFYKHVTPNDVFVNALTGVGYIRESMYLEKLPPADQEAAWEQYMDMSRRYFKRMDLSLLTTFEAFQLMPERTLARFTKLPGIKAIYRNYARFPDTTIGNAASELNGVPIFRAVFAGGGSLATPGEIKGVAAQLAQQLRQFTPAGRPAFLHVSLTNWFVDMGVLVETEKALGRDYVVVRPDHLPALYLEATNRR